jgi:hypothetical protein
MTIEEITEKLNSKQSHDRRRAAKEIGKLRIYELRNNLFQSYLKEKNDKRTWETQTEMIKSLGLIEFKEFLIEVDKIVNENQPHDMITMAAATTYVQLKRKSINDATPVIELLKFGSVSVVAGALLSLAVDRMKPANNEIEEILKRSRDINKHPDRIGREFGLIDSRIYLALVCADWEPDMTNDFLNHCIETAFNINRFNKPEENSNLIAVCKNSLKGKFSKGYI